MCDRARNRDDSFKRLETGLAELTQALKRRLGFIHTLEYEGIVFDISSVLVVADLWPLGFADFSEPIDADGEKAAVARLYERLLPLLTCEHQWVGVENLRGSMRGFATDILHPGTALQVCIFCTAYVLKNPEEPIPVIGKTNCPKK